MICKYTSDILQWNISQRHHFRENYWLFRNRFQYGIRNPVPQSAASICRQMSNTRPQFFQFSNHSICRLACFKLIPTLILFFNFKRIPVLQRTNIDVFKTDFWRSQWRFFDLKWPVLRFVFWSRRTVLQPF